MPSYVECTCYLFKNPFDSMVFTVNWNSFWRNFYYKKMAKNWTSQTLESCHFEAIKDIKSTQYKKLAVHMLKFEILQTTWKNKTKGIKMLNLLMKNWKLRVWCSLFHFFHVICNISNFNMWTEKHFAQTSCTELTLAILSRLVLL